MGSKLQFWDEYLKQRDENEQLMPGLMSAKNGLTDEAYKEGALSTRVKRLMALAVGLRVGCEACIVGQTQLALASGATNEEIFETISVATAMGGTPALAEAGKVMELLKELGRL
ncbi:MAG: carboxymuconolactone decarboxylase family protein [Chloroflexota bacterium]|jgi:AhpD family alkylhydroperoxidase